MLFSKNKNPNIIEVQNGITGGQIRKIIMNIAYYQKLKLESKKNSYRMYLGQKNEWPWENFIVQADGDKIIDIRSTYKKIEFIHCKWAGQEVYKDVQCNQEKIDKARTELIKKFKKEMQKMKIK